MDEEAKKMTMSVRVQKVRIHRSVEFQIKTHCRAEADKGRFEAVGFVARHQGESFAVAVMPLNNHSPDPTHGFVVEPWEQFRAESKLASQGYKIVGVYHSHVSSEALPSQFDHKLCRRGEYAFIYSVVFDDLRAFVEEDGVLVPAELEVFDS